ncbi:UDP-glucose/GDP-mannose dehydrogenase family protein [Patescibacteria group bacterium]|nr:UDP-glucose/GDP-mannose dehydrogenase family protein [Patescibacteria group bacterium]
MTKNQKNKIAIVGAGYVGLITGACFAEWGNEVICIDKDKDKIEKLKKGISPIYEPGLAEILQKNIKQGRLFFSQDLGQAVKKSEIIFICVGTPSARGGKVDISFIKEAAQEIARNMAISKIIVTKSTVPLGTARNLVAKIISETWKGSFELASNPEFLREGTAVFDFLNPDRVVIGTDSQNVKRILLNLYQKVKCPKIITTPENAEMIKYAANAFLAMKVSFINEIANLCEGVKADVKEIVRGIGLDKRIGSQFFKAGLGWGGSCFPKDVKGFYQLSKDNGYNFRLLRATIEVNNEQKKRILKKIKNLFPGQKLGNKTIGVLGLAFKGNTDDIRESPAIEITKKLQKLGANIKVYDPKAMPNAQKALPKIKFAKTPYEVAEDADLLVIATEWEEFKKLNWKKIKNLLKKPIIVDGRNLLNPIKMKKFGFHYIGVGRNI